jgi:hypothetical protein
MIYIHANLFKRDVKITAKQSRLEQIFFNHHELYGDRLEGAKESVPLRPKSRLNNSRLTKYDCNWKCV